MATPRRWTADVSARSSGGEIRWLVLEKDPGSDGWFLYGCTTSPDPREAKWDDWRLTREEILEIVEGWGVRADDWTPRLDEAPPEEFEGRRGDDLADPE